MTKEISELMFEVTQYKQRSTVATNNINNNNNNISPLRLKGWK